MHVSKVRFMFDVPSFLIWYTLSLYDALKSISFKNLKPIAKVWAYFLNKLIDNWFFNFIWEFSLSNTLSSVKQGCSFKLFSGVFKHFNQKWV